MLVKRRGNSLLTMAKPSQSKGLATINVNDLIVIGFAFVIWLIVMAWMGKYLRGLPP